MIVLDADTFFCADPTGLWHEFARFDLYIRRDPAAIAHLRRNNSVRHDNNSKSAATARDVGAGAHLAPVECLE